MAHLPSHLNGSCPLEAVHSGNTFPASAYCQYEELSRVPTSSFLPQLSSSSFSRGLHPSTEPCEWDGSHFPLFPEPWLPSNVLKTTDHAGHIFSQKPINHETAHLAPSNPPTHQFSCRPLPVLSYTTYLVPLLQASPFRFFTQNPERNSQM